MAEFGAAALSVSERAAFLTALVAPRPIALVSSLSASGAGNLAPFSFFMAAGYNPMSVAFSPVRFRDGREKDTLRNVRATGEFVINIATVEMAERLNQASYTYPAEVDEFDAAGFTRAPSLRVRPPRVAESAAALECTLYQVVEHGSGGASASYVIGEVVHLHVRDDVLVNGVPDNRRIEHVARLGAVAFGRVTPSMIFDLDRPASP